MSTIVARFEEPGGSQRPSLSRTKLECRGEGKGTRIDTQFLGQRH